MSKDKLTLKGNGYLMQLVLHSGGVKNFIFLDAVVGGVCIIFALVIQSSWPFFFWVIVTIAIFGLLAKLALSKDGWAFFLESNYLFKVVRMQMQLTGDKQIGRAKLEDAKLVQPILETSGDIETEAKIDYKKAITEGGSKK